MPNGLKHILHRYGFCTAMATVRADNRCGRELGTPRPMTSSGGDTIPGSIDRVPSPSAALITKVFRTRATPLLRRNRD